VCCSVLHTYKSVPPRVLYPSNPVLQCVEVCCSKSHRVAVCCIHVNQSRRERVFHTHLSLCCRVLQCVAACCSVLQCVEVCCSVLQCAAVCCSVFRHVNGPAWSARLMPILCCSVLQCVALCCSALQCIASCCSVLHTYKSVPPRVRVSHPFNPVMQCIAVRCSVLQ